MRRISKIVPNSNLDLSSLDQYIGKSCAELNSSLNIGAKISSKSFARQVIDGLIKKCMINFDLDRYQYKMIRIDQFGVPKNPSPFKITDYNKIILGDWGTSEFRQLLLPTYIYFLVTYGSPESSIFKGYVLHNFSDEELRSAEYVWTDTRDKIRNIDYDHFLTESDTGTFFFKCHASKVTCTTDAPGGSMQIYRSFWISKKLLSEIITAPH